LLIDKKLFIDTGCRHLIYDLIENDLFSMFCVDYRSTETAQTDEDADERVS